MADTEAARAAIRDYFDLEKRQLTMVKSILGSAGQYAWVYKKCAEYLMKHNCGDISLTDYSKTFDEEVRRSEEVRIFPER